MRTKFLATILLVFGLSISMVAATDDNSTPRLPIEIIKKEIPNQPRHLTSNFLECYYYSGVLYFMFSSDIGDVEISVISETNTWMKTMETSDGMDEICIANGGAGSYSVEIVTEYGECFTGNFEL
ncbi:MAG: DUF3244 domain-containing protein [Bacteroidaceae bacterium]|nr:DUF3244 domain-containing protein [Bacteroidaceae bacterium]